jgi:two-component system sensor histidine kinase UhpB
VATLLALAIQRKQVEDKWRGARQHMQALAKHLQQVQEDERRHLAQAIHDDLGQTIIGLQLDLAWLAQRVKGVPISWRRRLGSMATQLDELLNAVHHIGTELRPRILDDLGLRAAIESQLQEVLHRTGIASAVSWPSEELRLDKARPLAVFRIFQEALTNVLRHAKASHITVRARQEREAFSLHVSDNGKGITPAQVAHGTSLGLLGMRERAQLWGGEVTIHSTPREGTTVVVRLPYTASEEEEVVDDPHRDRR